MWLHSLPAGVSTDSLEAIFSRGGLAAVAEGFAPREIDVIVDQFSGGVLTPIFLHVMSGRRELAISLLEGALELHAFGKDIPVLVMHSALDPIRSDERFKAVLRAMGLPVVIPQ